MNTSPPYRRSTAFSLVEVMIAITVFSMLIAGTLSVYLICQRYWHQTTLNMKVSRDASLALARIVYGIGTNNGLRAASSISVDTNYHGHVAWTPYYPPYTNTPFPPDNTYHFLCSWGAPSYVDGSWRIQSSNAFDGIRYIDYNREYQNILLGTGTDFASRATRQTIGYYITDATAVTNSSGITLSITVTRYDGQFVASNTVSTFIKRRN